MKHFLTIIILLFIYSIIITAQPSITLSLFATGFTKPVDIANCNDSRLFVVEQLSGKIFIVDSAGNKLTTPFINISSKISSTGNERGLLGLTFDPNYKTNGFFYVNYTAKVGNDTHIARFSVSADPNIADPNSELILLVIDQPYSNHNGGCLKFGPDGYLYIGMGDGGSGGDPDNNAQNPKQMLGKILRIDPNGANPYAVPASNPFYNNADTLPEIWALGVRNPWRFSFDKLNGNLWMGDVGQDLVEEVNFQNLSSTGGENYGWRCYEANNNYNTLGCGNSSKYTFPIFTYKHNNAGGYSITGGYVYRGLQYANMYGYYLLADYVTGRFWAIKENNGTFTNIEIATLDPYQYSTFGQDVNGELYVAKHCDGCTGQIFHIKSNNCLPVAQINNVLNDTLKLCEGDTYTLNALANNDLKYSWQKNGTTITGQNTANLLVNSPGKYTLTTANKENCSATSPELTVLYITNPTPTIVGNTAVCTGASNTYSVAADPNSEFIWTVTGGTFVGQGSNSIIVTWTNTNAGTVSITQIKH